MFFLLYTLLLLLGGIAMIAVGVAVKEQGTGSRILNVVIGLAFFGTASICCSSSTATATGSSSTSSCCRSC